MRAVQNKLLLLLDEATSAMGKKTETFVLNLLRSLKDQLAIIFVTHRESAIEIADRVYVLEKGENIEKLNAII